MRISCLIGLVCASEAQRGRPPFGCRPREILRFDEANLNTATAMATLGGTRTMREAEPEPDKGPKTERSGFASGITILVALIGLLIPPVPAFSEITRDWITGLPRESIHVETWPGGKKVAVCFVLYVEVWGFGHGPNFRPDTASRDPDVVDESFRQYTINWGIPRAGRLFSKQNPPLSIALSAVFPRSTPMSGISFVPWSRRPQSLRMVSITRPNCFRLDAVSTRRKPISNGPSI